ncbi:hypothetical protein RCL1_003044 [Eukaryota sp. TZLM3-RCL]
MSRFTTSGSYFTLARSSRAPASSLRTHSLNHSTNSPPVSSPYRSVSLSNSICHHIFYQLFGSCKKPLFAFKSPDYTVRVVGKRFLGFANKIINVSVQTRNLFFQSLDVFRSTFIYTNVLCGLSSSSLLKDKNINVHFHGTLAATQSSMSQLPPFLIRLFPITSLVHVPLNNSCPLDFENILSIVVNKSNDLSMLHLFINLKKLAIQNNSFSSIEVVQAFPLLQYLDISDTNVIDITPLSTTPRLSVLILTRTKVTNIDILAFCKELRILFASLTDIEGISPLSQCTNLQILNLNGTKVIDISSLSVLTNLEQLRLEDVKVADLFPLLNCKRLSLLDVRNTWVKEGDRRVQSGNAKVQKFLKSFQDGFTCDLSYSSVDDLSSIVHCLTPRLKRLILARRNVSNISLIQMCSNLEFLDISGQSDATDFSFLHSLNSLIELNLSNSKFIDCSVLSSCSKLQSLNLCSTYVADLLPLGNCPELSRLNLRNTFVAKKNQRDVSSLKEVKTLINSFSNGFAFEMRDGCKDLSFLKENDRLVSFSCLISFCSADFSVLTTCKNLQTVCISGASGFPFSLLPTISQLREVHVAVNSARVHTTAGGLSVIAECKQLHTLKLFFHCEYSYSSYHHSQLAPLPPCPYIHTLDMSKLRVPVEFNFFASFSGLRSLNLNGTPFTDPWQLHSCTNLSFLDLRRTLVAERHRSVHRGQDVISELVASYTRGFEFESVYQNFHTPMLPSFVDGERVLSLRATSFHRFSLSDLSRCKIIETLALIDCSFYSIDILSSLITLKRIDFTQSRVDDISFVSSLTNLVSVNFSNTLVFDLNPLSNCKSILQVFLSNTPVSNLSPLAVCTQLEVLNLRNTRVDDISYLTNCRNLHQIDLRDTLLPANFRVEMKGKEEIQKVLYRVAIRSLSAHQHQSNKLWVRNFPESYSNQDLVELFQRFGRVEKCVVSTSSAGKVSATVHFRDIESANYAVQGLRGQSIGSCTLSLVYI